MRDERTGGQRQADAFGEAMERLLAVGDLPTEGGNRPQLIVTIDHASLLKQLPVGVAADGTELSPAVVRRLACDAGILSAVLGTGSRVLDLGRSARTATSFQRRALGLRDGGCGGSRCHEAGLRSARRLVPGSSHPALVRPRPDRPDESCSALR